MTFSDHDSCGLILQAERLVKRFGDVTAVDELSISIREGEILALLGPNGAGKTVTISMLCGLLKPDNGRVLFHGKPFDPSARGIIGLCPQNIVVWPKQTCLEQLVFIGEMYGLPARECRQRAANLLEALHLTEKRSKLAATLSGGMQRRLNLSLALMHDPQLLVLDEPEAGLDPQSRVLVREYVRQWASSRVRTVILTTHNMDEADRLADRVAIIDHGSLLVIDTSEALKRRVGQGDILEIEFGDDAQMAQKACEAVKAIVKTTSLQGHMLKISARGVIDLLPAITRKMNEAGIVHGDIRLRGNTLEDVFITLTGRRLRE
jgi:ABC-2 type transport system ATP-binding protein